MHSLAIGHIVVNLAVNEQDVAQLLLDFFRTEIVIIGETKACSMEQVSKKRSLALLARHRDHTPWELRYVLSTSCLMIFFSSESTKNCCQGLSSARERGLFTSKSGSWSSPLPTGRIYFLLSSLYLLRSVFTANGHVVSSREGIQDI